MLVAVETDTGHPIDSLRAQPNADAGERNEILHVGREDGFDFAGQEYVRLFEASAATAFQHPRWLRHFYETLAPHRRADKVVVTLRRAGGRLAGVLPLILRRKAGLRLLETTDLGVSDYAAPPIERDFRTGPACLPDLKRQIARVLPSYDILRIRPVRAEHLDDWAALLPGQVEPLGFGAPFARLGSDYPEWRRTRPSKSLLGRLSRADKRIAKLGGGRLVRLASPDEISTAVTEIQRLRAGRFPGDVVQDDIVRDFYAAVAVEGHEADLAEVFRLDIGGTPAGYVYGLGHRGRFYYLLIGCDYDNHGRCSPGLVLYDRIIADWIGRGGDVFDFTIGDEPFKADFGTETTPMFALVDAPTWRGRLALTAFRARARLRKAGSGDGVRDDQEPRKETGGET